ncbi:MAG: hypothetical protein BA863_05800 [Desulfovibrio sp. S3730MH75]|nr:MAG: hypothetical protein BA863_05800 [Desulfovibrio sp. S3730MH75]
MPIHSQIRSRTVEDRHVPLLIGAIFIASIGIGVFTFTLPLLSLDEKAGGLWLGTAFSGYFLAKLLISPLSGALSDRNGPNHLLLLSSGIGALLPLIYLFIPSIESLYAIQFALGLCAGTIKTVGMVAVGALSSKSALTKQFSKLSTGINTAFFLGPLLGGALYIDRDYFPVLSALFICMTISFLIFFFCPLPRTLSYMNTGTDTATGTGTDTSKDPNYTSTIRIPLLLIILAVFGRAIGIGSMITFYPVLIKTSMHLSPLATGMLFAIPNLATIILLPIFNHLPAFHHLPISARREFMTCAGMLLSGAGLYFIPDCTNMAGYILSGTVIGAGAALSIPSSMAICSELSPKVGKNLGLANLTANLGFILGPLLVGIIINFYGELSVSFKLVALAGAIFALPMLVQTFRTSSTNKPIKIFSAVACVAILFLAFMNIPLNSGSNLAQDLDINYTQGSTQKESQSLFRFSDVAMGTIVNLTLDGSSREQAEKAARQSIEIMRSLQRDFDHRNKMGSIGRINRAAGIKAVKISDKAFKLIGRSLKLGEQSKGLFEISIGAITTTPFYYVLDNKILSDRKPLVNYKLIEIDREKGSVKLPHTGMALDLGGIAKGSIIDGASEALKAAGIDAALVEAGGDFYGYGTSSWSIGIKDPRSAGLLGKIVIKNMAVCGSGDYHQFITASSSTEEARKHHILDPSLMRSSHESIATTAIAPTAETADALATAIFIMGPKDGTDFIKKYYPDCAAMWVMPDKSIYKTDNFPELTLSQKPTQSKETK